MNVGHCSGGEFVVVAIDVDDRDENAVFFWFGNL
jgi:hypothetical protein